MEQLETDQSIAWNQEIWNLPILKIIQSCVIPEAALMIKHEQDQVNCENPNWEKFISEKYSPLKNIPTKNIHPQKNIHPWKIFTPEKDSLLKNIHPWKIFTLKIFNL